MTEYISKQVKINKPDHMIYDLLSDFQNFTPILKDRVDEWSATDCRCSFKAKGFKIGLSILEKEPCKTVKIAGEDVPFEFFFWIQLKKVDEYDTRLRLTVHAKLNMMMKMMLGSKVQQAIDDVADQIAVAFNAR